MTNNEIIGQKIWAEWFGVDLRAKSLRDAVDELLLELRGLNEEANGTTGVEEELPSRDEDS